MKPKSVSIQKISEITGVSVATVSRVINNNGRFSKETERRVKKALEEYHYTPNLAARGLRTSKIPTVGVIVPDITNEYFARITLSLQERLFKANYSTIICNTNENVEIERRHLEMLLSQQVSGMIYISGTPQDLSRLSHLPSVFIDREPRLPKGEGKYLLIESDHYQGGFLAGQELLNQGCRKIAMLKYRSDISSHNSREQGFRKALEQAGRNADDVIVRIVREVGVEEGLRQTEALLESVAFDGLFCTADALAVGAVYALKKRGLHVPEDVRLVGYDDISLAQYGVVPLTSVHQSMEGIGRRGAEALLQIMDGKEPEKHHLLLPVHLIRRRSSE